MNLDRIKKLFKIYKNQNKELNRKQMSRFYSVGEGTKVMIPCLQLDGLDYISLGDNTTILDYCRLAVFSEDRSTLKKCSGSPSITIGNNCYIGFHFTALATDNGKITIGDNVLFASNVLVTCENHGINPESDLPYMEQELSSKNVSIGEGCWIGEKCCILPGVSIGKKSIIGAGAVVTKSIGDYSIAVGNPARVIKQYDFEKKEWKSIK